MRVGIGRREIAGDCVDHLLRHLRTARRVKEHCGAAVDRLAEGWELAANPFEVELAKKFWSGTHTYSVPQKCVRMVNQPKAR